MDRAAVAAKMLRFQIDQMFETVALGAVQIGHQGKTQHQGLDALQSQNHQGMADGADMLAPAVEAGIDGLKNFARHGRVFGNDARDLGNIDIGMLGHFQHLHRNGRQRGQVRAGLYP